MSEAKGTRTAMIDAKGLVLGRMASIVAKRLLAGERIVIVNADEAVISGKRQSILKEYEDYLQIGHFRKGPLHPRRPDMIVRKVVRGMLPRSRPKGKEALKRLRVYVGIPQEFRGTEKETIPKADISNLRGSFIRVSELARNVGWKEGA